MAMFDLPAILTSKGIHTSPTLLLDPENVRAAFGISLLFSTEAEIMRYFICIFANGGHRQFAGYLEI